MKYLAFHCISDASFHIFSLVLEIEGKKYSDTLENIWKLRLSKSNFPLEAIFTVVENT